MPEYEWSQENDRLVGAIERKAGKFNNLFRDWCQKARGRVADDDLLRRVKTADAELRKAKDALYRHTEEHNRRSGATKRSA
jgi:hypothetical protein